MIDLQAPSSLIFEKSDLNDLDFSRSVLTIFRLSESKIDDAAFTGTIADNVELVNSELFFSMSDSKVQNLLLSGSHVRAMVLNSAILPKVTIRDCKNIDDMGFYQASIGELLVEHCTLKKFDLIEATVKSATIRNSSLSDCDNSDVKVGELVLDNVTLGAKIDFTNARVDHLKVKNLQKRPGLRLITTGSNLKLD